MFIFLTSKSPLSNPISQVTPGVGATEGAMEMDGKIEMVGLLEGALEDDGETEASIDGAKLPSIDGEPEAKCDGADDASGVG